MEMEKFQLRVELQEYQFLCGYSSDMVERFF